MFRIPQTLINTLRRWLFSKWGMMIGVMIVSIALCYQLYTALGDVVALEIGKSNQPRANPVWTWQCISDRCEKVLLNENDVAQSLDTCKVLCGKYSMLWPRPTGQVELGDSLTTLSPYGMSTQLGPGRTQLSEKVATLVRDASTIFRNNVRDLAKGIGEIHAVGKSLMIQASITDGEYSRVESNTDESYQLEVSETSDGRINATIEAPNFFGFRHGLETLLNLIIFNDLSSELQMFNKALITDKPMFPHRGLSLDTSRNFISVDSIKRTLDGMAATKLNTFHWHITDSHSFPFQSETYPQFTQYGAYSPRQIYSASDIQSLVEYARVRGVRIVPEFDAPAHVGEGWQWAGPNVTVCVKAEPWTSYCVEPPCGQLNPTNDTMYEILGGIYNDMFKLFDSDIFHMGGDEVNLNCWNSTEEIVRWLGENGLDRDEKGFMQLWDKFQTTAFEKVKLANGGKTLPIVLWTSTLTEQDDVEKYLDPSTYIIQIWTKNDDRVIANMINKKYRIIMTNYDALYFDCGFGAWVGEGNNWCSPYKGWQAVYMNSPYNILKNLGVDVTDEVRSLVLGGEAALWVEQVDDQSVDGRLWPRSSALAERLWSDPVEHWTDAEHRMLYHRQRLVQRGIKSEILEPVWCLQNHGYCYL